MKKCRTRFRLIVERGTERRDAGSGQGVTLEAELVHLGPVDKTLAVSEDLDSYPSQESLLRLPRQFRAGHRLPLQFLGPRRPLVVQHLRGHG
jgi:hypothetical protein